MVCLHFEKISRFERKGEICSVAVPFAEGECTDVSKITISDGDKVFKPQTDITAVWGDGSAKWVHVVFPADLPANASCDYYLNTDKNVDFEFPKIGIDGLNIDTGKLHAVLGSGEHLFKSISLGDVFFSEKCFTLPVIMSDGKEYRAHIDTDWEFCEEGPYRVVVGASGKHYSVEGDALFGFFIRLHFELGQPWFKLEYRFVNNIPAPATHLERLYIKCGPFGSDVKTALGISNYRTKVETGDSVYKLIDTEHVLFEANEHISETFYGTFFADARNANMGVCATVHQAQQNYPKALGADADGLVIELYPKESRGLEILRGVSKTHNIFFHLHDGRADVNMLNVRSLMLQMPNRPSLDASVYAQTKVFGDIFLQKRVPEFDALLMKKADSCGCAFGMLNWGDYPDAGYTRQGRGKGRQVWSNNEYDCPHAYFLLYAETGERRFLDKFLVAVEHWMDVDICHSSDDPLRLGGQYAHTARHTVGGDICPSHEWVEGLLDYCHVTGNRRALTLAIGIGENVSRLLETPEYSTAGGSTARETGWALRTFTALYVETGEERWLSKCEWIVGHFKAWGDEYGTWLMPYTDHSAIRVPFMISVAASSLMRYYRVRPSESLKNMIINAIDDILENCLLPSGIPYYKELPSLRYPSVNPLLLETLAYCYELTGDKKYVEAGVPLFRAQSSERFERAAQVKVVADDGEAVIYSGAGTKQFANSYIPLVMFMRAIEKSGVDLNIGGKG